MRRAKICIDLPSKGSRNEECEAPEEQEQVAESLVKDLGKGESFGELSLIYNTFREATFKAVEDSEARSRHLSPDICVGVGHLAEGLQEPLQPTRSQLQGL